ncbi:histidine phosphatase family protein [Rhodopirellula sp. SWK7]|uniref:histidine phosphatase family protein n=1 Tax=Rhodopirellula sp. SWK7 TaxID=595460 RepID=UPI0005C60E18|nr:histidine phosphatase family protein [Rhodopirellula sp. SWK7]
MNTHTLQNRFYVLRHGQSTANEQSLIASSPAVAINDYRLTAAGREQVRRSIASNRDNLGTITRVVTSDFCRTRQTAEIASDLLNAPIQYAPELRERLFGSWDEQSNANYQTVWDADAQDASHQRWGVESVQSVSKRMLGFLREINLASEREAYLFVSHGDPLQILITALAGEDLRHHRQIQSLETAEVRSLA